MNRTACRMIVALALCISLSAAADASAYRNPNASFKVGDPGVLFANGEWNVLATGSWGTMGTVSTSAQAAGPWRLAPTHLLTRRPGWASAGDHSIWAPSETRVGNAYVVFYAAVIRGEQSKRCIGTGISSSPIGPFIPRDRPISCVAGHGARDPEPGVAANNSTIDATPSWVTNHGRRRLYLTYKTQHRKPDGHYFSTIRMVRLDDARLADGVLGRSRRLTTRPDNIEENPVLVQRGRIFTLFTSLGGYTLCSYHTEWRQSTSVWRWPAASHRLSFPAGTNTCGTGDAQVVRGLRRNSWRIFYSGRYPAASSSFKLYAGTVGWSAGTPEVTSILAPPAGPAR